MMDIIDNKQIKKLNKLVLAQTKSLLNYKIDAIYFDAITLYFESFTEDIDHPEYTDKEIRKNEYSEDGKFDQPRVVLALLAIKQGLPVGYKAFNRGVFDCHTIISSLKQI